MKFTAEWSQPSSNFLDVTVTVVEGVTETNLYVKPTVISIYNLACNTLSTVKRVYHIVRL